MYSPILGGCDYSIRVVNILNRLRRMIKHEKIKERESNEPCPCSICSNVLKRCKDSHLDLHLNDVSHPSPLEREIHRVGTAPSAVVGQGVKKFHGWLQGNPSVYGLRLVLFKASLNLLSQLHTTMHS